MVHKMPKRKRGAGDTHLSREQSLFSPESIMQNLECHLRVVQEDEGDTVQLRGENVTQLKGVGLRISQRRSLTRFEVTLLTSSQTQCQIAVLSLLISKWRLISVFLSSCLNMSVGMTLSLPICKFFVIFV